MNDFELARRSIGEIDREMTVLFAKRMEAVGEIARYKADHHLPVADPVREEALLRDNLAVLEGADADLRDAYASFFRQLLCISKEYQNRLIGARFDESDPIWICSGAIGRLVTVLAGYEKVLIVTDAGVPAQYAMRVGAQCKNHVLLTLPEGEATKSVGHWKQIGTCLLENGFTRSDAIVAVGGGVVGDICGFAASTYLRGIDWIDLPTTLLAQLDASAGGKTAIDFGGIKNTVGSFYPPKKVVIDPDTLLTLPDRALFAGLAEAIKMAATCDMALFEELESCTDLRAALPSILPAALRIKIRIVTADPFEKGLRRLLNFGHTVGHAAEAASSGKLLHGEAVAIGMLPMCGEAVRERVGRILVKYHLPTALPFSPAELLPYIAHDKKRAGEGICCVLVDEIGSYRFAWLTEEEILRRMEDTL